MTGSSSLLDSLRIGFAGLVRVFVLAGLAVISAAVGTNTTAAEPAPVDDWPTYMRDNRRSGATLAELPTPLALHWRWQSPQPPHPAWPPPARQDFWHNQTDLPARVTYDRAMHVVSDGRLVLFGSSSDDQVRALDIATGIPQWSFFCEGPVRLAPTLWEGRAYFGSDDGAVYCVALNDGKLVWKFRPFPEDRRIAGNERIVSVWPVRTGVLIENGRARFAAGLFPEQGVRQFALDAQTGRPLADAELSFSPQGYLQMRGDQLMAAAGRAPDGLVSRLERTTSGDDESRAVDRPADKSPIVARIATANLRIEATDGRIVAFDLADGRERWNAEVAGRAYSLAVAAGRLLVSTDAGTIYAFGSPDTAPADAPPARDGDAVEAPFAESRNGSRPVSEAAAAAREKLARTHRDGAQHLVANLPDTRGYALVIGEANADVAASLAEATRMTIVAVEPDPTRCDASRHAFDAASWYGRVSIHQNETARPPYGSLLFNVVVVTAAPNAAPPISAVEAVRMLRPGGMLAALHVNSNRPEQGDSSAGGASSPTSASPQADGSRRTAALALWSAALDRERLRTFDSGPLALVYERAALAGVGDWTHMYANPANTSNSDDQLVGGELLVQWFGPPGPRDMLDRHHRTVPPLSIAGRLFIPGDNRVYGVDAYNGTVLWETEVAGARRVAAMRDAGSMAAAPETLYVAAREQCIGLDAATGRAAKTFSTPSAKDGSPRHWGMAAVVGDRLFGSSTRPGASRADHSRRQINETFWDNVPLVVSDAVFAVDRYGGERAWRYDASRGAIVNPTLTLGNGRVYFVESDDPATLDVESGRVKATQLLANGASLVALDAATGEVVWRQPFELRELQHHVYLSLAQDRLIVVGSKNRRGDTRTTVWYDIACHAAADGRLLWTATQDQGQGVNGDHGEQDHHPVIVGDRLFVEPQAYDLKTGERRADWRFARGGHGCGSMSASADRLFFRAGNPTMCDLATGHISKVTRVSRPGCWINIIPAGGLVLIPEASSGCTCNFPIQTSLALIPASLAGRATDDVPD